MPRTSCRKLTLSDIMILVAFAAAGFAGGRYVLESQGDPVWVGYLLGVGSPLMVSVTLAIFLLRLRQPRPSFSRAFRQPGAAASLACLGVFGVWSVFCGLGVFNGKASRAIDSVAYTGVSAGAAVIGAWLILGVTRTVRPEKGWIDRVGIGVGLGWIALLMVVLYDNFST